MKNVQMLFRHSRDLPPNPAASQALMERGEDLPDQAPLPIDHRAAIRLGDHWVLRVAGETTDVEALAHLAKQDRRQNTAAALLQNPALPEDLVLVAARRVAGSKSPGVWHQILRKVPWDRLDVLFDIVEDRPKYVSPKLLWELVTRGYVRAARVLENSGESLSWDEYPEPVTGTDGSVIQRLHDAGLHMWAAAMLDWWYVRGPGWVDSSFRLPAAAIRAGLESAIQSGRELYIYGSSAVDIPEDLIPGLAINNHKFVMRCGYDLPEDWVIENMETLLDGQWPWKGRWAHITGWTPGVKAAVLAALRDVPSEKAQSRASRFGRILEGRSSLEAIQQSTMFGTPSIGAALPGVDEVPVTTWAHTGNYWDDDGIAYSWWLKHSAGRARSVDEALAFLAAAPKGSTSLGALLKVFVEEAPEEWSDEGRARVAAGLARFGDITEYSSADPARLGSGAVLGDNVEAWKLFYSLTADASPDAGPMELADTAVELTSGR